MKIPKREEIVTLINKLKSLKDCKNPVLMKKKLLLSFAAIAIASIYFTSINDRELEEELYKYATVDGTSYQVDTLINKIVRGEISVDKLNADAYYAIFRAENNDKSLALQNSVFNKVDTSIVSKLKHLDNAFDWFNSSDLRDPKNMKMSEYGKHLLKSIEALKLVSYKLKGENYYTIGYGHAGPDVKPDEKITIHQADKLFEKDVREIEAQLRSACADWMKTGTFAGLTQDMFDALVIYIFNRGIGTFRNGSMLTDEIGSLITSDYDKCYKYLKKDVMQNKSKYYSSVDSIKAKANPGWKYRRAAEAELFRGNKFNYEGTFNVPAHLVKAGVFKSFPKISKAELLQENILFTRPLRTVYRSSLSSDNVRHLS